MSNWANNAWAGEGAKNLWGNRLAAVILRTVDWPFLYNDAIGGPAILRVRILTM
jgi:hypothetical protein